MVLKKMFEDFIDPALHSGSRGLVTKVFGTTPPVDIIENIQHLYGKLSYQELDAALIHLNKTMQRMELVKVMLRGFEEVQIFLLSNLEK